MFHVKHIADRHRNRNKKTQKRGKKTMEKYEYNKIFKTKKSALEYAESQSGAELIKLDGYNIYKAINSNLWYSIEKLSNKWVLKDYINVTSVYDVIEGLEA